MATMSGPVTRKVRSLPWEVAALVVATGAWAVLDARAGVEMFSARWLMVAASQGLLWGMVYSHIGLTGWRHTVAICATGFAWGVVCDLLAPSG